MKSQKTYNFEAPWVDSPFLEEELKASKLDESTKKQVKSYADNGFLIMDTNIPHENLDRIVSELEPLYKEPRIQDAWKISPTVKGVAGAPEIMQMLRILYGREPFPFQTLNFHVGSQQKTHSDAIHFYTIPNRFMCGVWVALEDADETNGALHYYPGSHKLPFYQMNDIGLRGSDDVLGYNQYLKYEEFVADLMIAAGLKKQVFKVKKGQALIWAANLFHGGEPILKEGSTRHSQVTHYFFNDCIYYSPLWSDIAVESMFLRKPVNALTGEVVQNSYLGNSFESFSGINPLNKPKHQLENVIQKVRKLIKSSS